ncbi:MAG TPA: hypothetical protein VF886_03135 [Roseiarcus sp.]
MIDRRFVVVAQPFDRKPAFAQSRERAARVVCGSQPVASVSAASVTPVLAPSISTTSACFDPVRGEAWSAVGRFAAAPTAFARTDFPPSSSPIPIASRPARVITRPIGRPSSSRQTGMPGLALTSRMSFAP